MHKDLLSYETIRTIPKWFNLKNYEPLKTFTPKQWHYQLLIRSLLRRALNNPHTEENAWLIQEFMDGIIEHTLLPFDINQLISESSDLMMQPSVKPTLPHEIYEIMIKILDKNYGLYSTPLDDVIFEDQGQYPKEIHLTIDLSATDKQIINDLKHYLPKARKRYLPEKESKDGKLKQLRKGQFSPATFENLFTLKVLPFIDIKLWESISGQKIYRPLLGKTLFPGDSAQAELRINDTLDKYFEYLLDRNILHRLDQYAQSEKTVTP